MNRFAAIVLGLIMVFPACSQAETRPELPQKGRIEAMKTLADKGDLVALTGLADALYFGTDTGKDPKEARRYYLLAAEKGQVSAAYALARMLKTGEGGDPDPEKAFFWVTVALCTPRNEAVKRELEGWEQELGKSLSEDLRKKARKEAHAWFDKNDRKEPFVPDAAEQQKAAGLLAKAEAGDALAQYLVGNLVFMGYGFPRDYAKAAEWYKKSAEHGNPDAQLSLGLLFHQGLGVGKSRSEAYFWLTVGLADPSVKGSPWEQFRNLPMEISLFLNEDELKDVEKRLQERKTKKE